jgi:uncharacterized membrane protein
VSEGPERAAPRSGRAARYESSDLLRGAVMALMALDHVREHLHRDALRIEPTDLTHTEVAVFLTRWVTHFCAPVFVFLAGAGAFLRGARDDSKSSLSRFLLTRGLWLIALEFTIVGAEWHMGPRLFPLIAQVIWALGVSMVALSALIFLPVRVVGAIGVIIIAGHNLLDGLSLAHYGALRPLWQALHAGGSWPPGGAPRVLFVYPVLPWIGVMAAGYAFGTLYRLTPEARRARLFALGLALTAAFVALRAVNLYGDPRPWSAQARGAAFTILSFLNCQKYPPSLLYLLMTLGPALLLLAAAESGLPALARPLIVLGRVPLFFYVLHLLVVDLLSIALAIARYGTHVRQVFANGLPADYGYGLGVVYLAWVGVLIAVYPACAWFARLKSRSRAGWLSYF